MPFVQRVVQPVNLAQCTHGASTASASGKFPCMPGRCKNNNCLNSRELERERQQAVESNVAAAAAAAAADVLLSNGEEVCVKDTPTRHQAQQQQQQQQQQPRTLELGTTTVVKAIVHSPQLNGEPTERHTPLGSPQAHTPRHINGFTATATATTPSFSFATDTEEELVVLSTLPSPGSPGLSPPATLSMKKLRQHVEFLSSAPSPARSLTRDVSAHSLRTGAAQQRRDAATGTGTAHSRTATPQSPTAAKIISGYEFDSISNITLSNALRQLASLVLLASDIFDELQLELQSVSERTRVVHRKMVAVERRVCAYDPKMVTVPESDLLTFAQRKTHYDCDKSLRKELFTADTRPRSVRVLYEDAGRVWPLPSSRATSPRGTPFGAMVNGGAVGVGVGVDGAADFSGTGAGMAAGSDELVCTPVFGKANRKMRTRIDAEIEIRLPAAIEDLRKWTSSEALGDVTVTPDCMHHVDMSISTSVVIGDNGVLTPALSPSVLSADAVDALYSINVSNAIDNTQSIPNDVNKDVPLNHRLPSPEEQCKIIALRYPAEVITVDTSGKRFERMCMARKSTTGCPTSSTIGDANNLNDDVQTVSRRSRSRKVRGKRRNTIAGIDQKEIQNAANGDSTATGGELKSGRGGAIAGEEDGRRAESKSKKFGRSKSSDILKKESVALPYDKGKSTLARLNSLKQWGRNRFKFMQSREPCPLVLYGGAGGGHDTSGSSHNTSSEKTTDSGVSGSGSSGVAPKPLTGSSGGSAGGGDIDDECVVHALVTHKSESRFSHERKPSYSSSEKSMSVSSSGHLKGKLHLATCGNVKLRDTSSLNRQRRSGITANGLSGKEEQPHSSSGNWSASSESGRASIGSEITIQPKSSASNTSLNVSSFHPGSGPPSSMLSRRRFLNTSASSSVSTSEGTATPDLQTVDGSYPNHLDDETSSAYSCDTEGYYTSFHMDSGLRTLKEEEPQLLQLQSGQTLHTSSFSFGSQSNQTVLSAENEYELFGRGSTSTTTSSAGTVCTALLANGEQSSLNSLGPDVPERISSLSKLNKNSNHSNSASSSTLERSYSSSTIGSTLERTGTIKRNVNAGLKLVTAEGADLERDIKASVETPESQEDEFNFDQKLRWRGAQPLPPNAAAAIAAAEVDCSESSDLEGVERIERIKQKTAINAHRIPSMCIITPTTSDDENQPTSLEENAYDPNRTLTNEESFDYEPIAEATVAETFVYCTVEAKEKVAEAPLTPTKGESGKDHNLNVLKRGVFEKLKVVLPSIKRSPGKCAPTQRAVPEDPDLYDVAGEYVTIADISNNNRHNQLPAPKATVGASSLGIYYSNDIVRRKQHATMATTAVVDLTKGNEPSTSAQQQQQQQRETEYVSLNELPANLRGSGQRGSAFATNNEPPPTPRRNETMAKEPAAKCAESTQPQQRERESAAVPMYAEISELQEEKALILPQTSAAHQQQQQLQQHKGARVRVNAQGKIIYDSDSLKRRKGAHTTFAPGPYVKETESALAANANATVAAAVSESVSSAGAATQQQQSQTHTAAAANLVPKSNAAKLLLLNGGIAATRKVANVRPIVSTTPYSRLPQTTAAAIANNMPITVPGAYAEQPQSATNAYQSYQDSKQLLANHTNPFYQPTMMPSPSTKSTSSTGSTISSSASTHTSGSSSTSSSKEEGYQRFYKAPDQNPPQQRNESPTVAATPFQRNTPIYWTLQNRRQTKPQASSVTCRDDLYATPIRRSERVARAAAATAANTASNNNNSNSNISPIVPRNGNGFTTSTPNRGDELQQTPTPGRHNVHWDDNSPERFNTCSDRIGHSKTSLMDFKKLLLAKSSKSSPTQKKVSAVELLKKGNNPSPTGSPTSTPVPTLNSSMKLLDLSGSPKTFANRRMLRQGQFGSPSKAFAPKLKSSTNSAVAGNWRHNDIMSTTIPEANSEEDHSNTSGGSRDSSEAGEKERKDVAVGSVASAAQRYDLKRNFFLQTEENNFMRGELKSSFGKAPANAQATGSSPLGSKYVCVSTMGTVTPTRVLKITTQSNSSNFVPNTAIEANQSTVNMPALETAL